MSFKLSKRSLQRLEGVDSELVAVVKRAIEITSVDFGVICGMRSIEEQEALVAKGASKTMKSRHLTGHAVDLLAYIDGRHSWELNLYDEIADAMRQAAIELGTPLRWGACWHINNLCSWNSSCEAAMMDYIDTRRAQGRRPFLDGPHFEIPKS